MTPAPRTLPRRTVLAVSGTAVLAAAAACSSASTTAESAVSAASSAASSVKDEVTAAASSARTAASSAVSSVKEQVSSAVAAAPTTAAAPTSAATAPSGTPLASVASVESATSVVIGENQNAVLLASSNGTVVAHTAVCTHQGCVIAASGACPCHGSKFNITTGAVENGPANQPLAEVAVTVFDGQVYKV